MKENVTVEMTHVVNMTSCRGCFRLQVLVDGDRAVGVEFVVDGRTRTVRCRREVALCAGAIQTPHILMCSGIGPREHLEKAKVPFAIPL